MKSILFAAVLLAGPDVWLTVNPLADTVPQVFTIAGAAPGADVVHIWAWPASGPVFLGYSLTDQPDPIRQFQTSGFSLLIQNAPVGTYPIVVYAHDPTTGTFPVQQTIWVTVRPCSWTAACFQFASAGMVPIFQLSLYCS